MDLWWLRQMNTALWLFITILDEIVTLNDYAERHTARWVNSGAKVGGWVNNGAKVGG